MDLTSVPASARRPRFARAALLALVSASALFAAGLPAYGALRPEDFDVQIQMEPDQSPPQPNCTTDATGAQLCTTQFDLLLSGHEATGTVRHLTTGLSGSIGTVCDMEMHNRVSMRFPANFAGPPEFLEFSGSGNQSCSWHMDFSDGSTMTGRISGTMSMALVDGATGTVHMSARFNVDVVAGTGVFEDLVGSGSFAHEEDMQVGAPGGGGPGPNAASLRTASVARQAASGSGSKMNLRLRKGKSSVRVVSPGKTLEKSNSAPLHAVTVPGASCNAVARRAARKVSLGSAKAKSNGSAEFRGSLAKKLRSGKWRLGVSCSYRDKKKGKRTAKTSRTVGIA